VSAAALLDRLQGVRSTGPGRWIARCPAHEDRRPSLSIRELDDGRVLLHDFGGCGTDAVLAAVGVEMSALFPPSPCGHHLRPTASRIPARDLLELIDRDTLTVCIIAGDLLAKHTIDEQAWRSLAAAAARIGEARNEVHGR
jgi:hypothetical protein